MAVAKIENILRENPSYELLAMSIDCVVKGFTRCLILTFKHQSSTAIGCQSACLGVCLLIQNMGTIPLGIHMDIGQEKKIRIQLTVHRKKTGNNTSVVV